MGVCDDEARDLAEIGRRFRVARVGCDLTQAEAARAAGISQSALSLVERGRRSCGAFAARDLAIIYGVSLDWVYGISDDGGPARGMPPMRDGLA